jgi:hypothetical protein
MRLLREEERGLARGEKKEVERQTRELRQAVVRAAEIVVSS